MRIAIFLFCAVLIGPYILFSDGALRQDFSLRGERLEAAYILTTDRSCISTGRIFHQCSFDYTLNGVEHSQRYNMFAFGAPETIFLLQGTETGRLTSTTGQEYFWNRFFTMIFTMFFSFMVLIKILKYSSSDAPRATPNRAPRNPVQAQHARPRANNGASFGKRSHFQS